MPQMGVSVAEGTILEWRKRRGRLGRRPTRPISDVTTDKVDVEIPSPGDGRLAKILVEAGDTVPVGDRDRRDRRRRWPGSATSEAPRAHAGRGSCRDGDPAAAGGEPRPRRGRSVRLRLPRRAPDRRQARRRSRPGRRDRDRRADPQEGPARAHRVRRQAAASRGPGGAEAPAHRVALRAGAEPPAATARSRRPSTGRREPMSPMRQAIAEHMVRQPARRPRTARRSSRSTCRRRGAPRRAEGADARGAASAHLPGVRRPGDRRGARGAPDPERVDRRRRDRLPRRRQPRHRGGARRRA